jgi:hypothetical protein
VENDAHAQVSQFCDDLPCEQRLVRRTGLGCLYSLLSACPTAESANCSAAVHQREAGRRTLYSLLGRYFEQAALSLLLAQQHSWTATNVCSSSHFLPAQKCSDKFNCLVTFFYLGFLRVEPLSGASAALACICVICCTGSALETDAKHIIVKNHDHEYYCTKHKRAAA